MRTSRLIRYRVLSGLIGACLLAAPALAQAPTPAQLATFKVNDKNKDGKLDKAEFQVVARAYGFGPQADGILGAEMTGTRVS